MKMTVTLHRTGSPPENREVASLEEAGRVLGDWRDAQGMAASEMGLHFGEVREAGRLTHKVSYNGRLINVRAWKETAERLAREAFQTNSLVYGATVRRRS